MRDRLNAFIDRHDIAWELAMALLAVVYVAVGFALDDQAFQSMAPTLELLELGLTGVFAAEFLSRLLASRGCTPRSHLEIVSVPASSHADFDGYDAGEGRGN